MVIASDSSAAVLSTVWSEGGGGGKRAGFGSVGCFNFWPRAIEAGSMRTATVAATVRGDACERWTTKTTNASGRQQSSGPDRQRLLETMATTS